MSVRHRMRYPDLETKYELHETLGSGGFAKVKAGVHKLTGEKVAVKIMDKEQLGADLPRVYREIRALKKLHHQHICQMFEVIETRKMIFMIIEFCPGGELFDYIVAKERLREKEARSFFRQIVAALNYVHENGFIHRDLKPENLLLDEDSNIKLIDFGLVSEPNDTKDLLETCCGSPAYAAPELIRGGPYVGTKADVWSLGVLLYALLNGFLPFDDDHTPYLYRLIQRGEYETPIWLSAGSVNVIARLLQTDPERRITVKKLLHHNWVMEGYEKPVDWRSKIEMTHLDPDCVAELARYHQKSSDAMMEEILQWKYDEVTATYFLLLQQKHRGKYPIIRMPKKPSSSSVGSSDSIPSPLVTSTNMQLPNGHPLQQVSKGSSSEEENFHTPEGRSPQPQPKFERKEPSPEPPDMTAAPRRMSLGQPMHPPMGEILTLQKPTLLHPAVAIIRDSEESLISEASPQLPSHPPVGAQFSLPVGSLPVSLTMDFGGDGLSHTTTLDPFPPEGQVKKTRSYDANLYNAVEQVPKISTPQPRRRRIGSIEGLVKKAKKAFRRHSEASGPRRLKGIYDVSTTSSTKTSSEVLQEVERVLQSMNVEYKRKGYSLRCHVPSYKKDAKATKMVVFNLEVCLITMGTLNLIGVRRKRMKGDTWEYKKICDQIFKATKL